MLNLQTIAGSRFVSAFIDRVRQWERTLNLVSECLEAWFIVQRKWAYLEGIFIGAEDIRMQLPEEAKKFDAIDRTFKNIMTATSKNPNAVDACTADNRLAVLITLSDRLDNCQKSLSDYLDTKRCAFPRFFFISDDELLSVLGNNDPTSIQAHLLKLFDNVKEMQFSRNNKVTPRFHGSITPLPPTFKHSSPPCKRPQSPTHTRTRTHAYPPLPHTHSPHSAHTYTYTYTHTHSGCGGHVLCGGGRVPVPNSDPSRGPGRVLDDSLRA
jgi:Dynein heavy chain, N-terminal region 2